MNGCLQRYGAQAAQDHGAYGFALLVEGWGWGWGWGWVWGWV